MPKQVDVEQKRTEIAYATWSVIADRGLQAATLRAVAAEAGLSLGAVQHYFDSRESLLLYACRSMADLAAQQWSATSSSQDARDLLSSLANTSLTDNPLQRVGIAAWNAFVGQATRDAAMAEIVQQVWAGAHAEATRLWCEALAGETTHPASADPATVAENFLAMLDGLSLRVFADRLSFDDARRLAENFLDDYLGRNPGRIVDRQGPSKAAGTTAIPSARR